jgi:NitT/TauT family transport system substrate-binding protein
MLVYRILIIVLLAGASASFAQDRLVVAYDGFSGQQGPLWLASDLGLFRKYGVELDIALISNAAARTAALAAGELHFSVGSGASPITSSVSGADSVIIGTYYNRHLYSFVSTPEIRNPAQDLRGKNIGVSGLGGASHVAVVIALKQIGVDARTVTIMRAGGTSERAASLTARRLAATVLIEPFTEKVRKLGFPIILDLGKLKEAFPTVSLATTRKYLATNREVTKKFLKGISEGIYVFKTNRELALKSLAKWMKTQDSETLDLTYKSHFPKMDFPPITELSGIDVALEFLSHSRPEVKNRESEEFVNEAILAELQQENFFRNLSKSGK